VVTTSWLVTVVSYAVHYARIAATVGGLTFPGDKSVVFWDCVYLATQVQTTFSSSDVTIETTLTRRIITGHTLVRAAVQRPSTSRPRSFAAWVRRSSKQATVAW
jgi:uncharacterized membrane protein